MGSKGVMGAEEDKGAAIYLMLDGSDTTGIGNMAVWGFGAKCWTGWMGEWIPLRLLRLLEHLRC